MDKIKNQLAGVAALLGVIAAIGGGFVKYGEITTKLEALESANVKDFSAEIAVLEEKVNKLADEVDGSVNHSHTKTLVNEKQIELLKNQIEEIKIKSSNPLAQ
jgi:outer membrane murein-binding lipoprotein Lpp